MENAPVCCSIPPVHLDELQPCPLCGGTFTIRALLEAVFRYWPALNVVYSRSPCCQAQEELEVHVNKVVRGYIYAAGAPHFCGMDEYEVPGLALEQRGKDYWLCWESRERLLPTG